MKLEVQPATAERWKDVETVFGARGCSVARGCWCMYYRHTGKDPEPPAGMSRTQMLRSQLKRLTRRDPPPGLIGYRDGVPVGWIALGPRADFAKLQRSPVMKPVDEQPVWSIVCFVVPAEHRRQGVAAALLRGAIEYARARGVRILEAYPVDRDAPSRDDALWFGAKSMYDAAGFIEVARRKPNRPVVRLALTGRRAVVRR